MHRSSRSRMATKSLSSAELSIKHATGCPFESLCRWIVQEVLQQDALSMASSNVRHRRRILLDNTFRLWVPKNQQLEAACLQTRGTWCAARKKKILGRSYPSRISCTGLIKQYQLITACPAFQSSLWRLAEDVTDVQLLPKVSAVGVLLPVQWPSFMQAA